MKTKIIFYLKILLILLSALLLCVGIFYLVDVVWNGTFIEWFESNYMITNERYSPFTDAVETVREPDWSKLKTLLYTALILNVIIWIVIVIITAYIHGKRKFREAVTRSGQLIHKYMLQKQDLSDVFPNEFAEISTQMSEIKSVMIRNEQILKDEATRKNDLIAYLAHDLKTPLTSVIGYLSLIDEAPDMPAEQKAKYVSISLDKALRLEKLINEFFEITRYNLQQITLDKEPTDIHYMLVQMTDEFYPILKAHGNAVELRADENLTISVDAVKLARVFNNILKNAVSYSYPGTTIEIIAKSRNQEVSILFRNKGKTIPKQKLESVFEKFFRLDDARTSNTGGAGLGLAIAKEIIILHGGSINAASKNEITTFSVTLPL